MYFGTAVQIFSEVKRYLPPPEFVVVHEYATDEVFVIRSAEIAAICFTPTSDRASYDSSLRRKQETARIVYGGSTVEVLRREAKQLAEQLNLPVDGLAL